LLLLKSRSIQESKNKKNKNETNYDREFKRQAYYPNNIGYLQPANEFDFEFLIIGKDIPGATYKVINFFLTHYVKLLGIKSLVDEKRKEFSLSLLCDMEDSDIDPKDLANEIRKKMQFVTCLESMEMRGRMFGRSFPLTFYDKYRAVALGSNTMIRLALRLARKTGAEGPQAMYDEGRLYAKEALSQLREFLGRELPEMRRNELAQTASYNLIEDESDEKEQGVFKGYCVKCRSKREIQSPKQVIFKNNRKAIQGICPICGTTVFRIGAHLNERNRKLARLASPLIENMQGFLSAAGWGAFELRTAISEEERASSVTILDPPTFEGDIASGNQFLQGIAAGFLETILGVRNEMRLIGEKYRTERRILSLEFAEGIPSIEKEIHPLRVVHKQKVERKRIRSTRFADRRRRQHRRYARRIEANQQQEQEVENEVQKIIRSLEEIEAANQSTTTTEKQILPDSSPRNETKQNEGSQEQSTQELGQKENLPLENLTPPTTNGN
jgi:predicted amino acid-binding ACT domain protein